MSERNICMLFPKQVCAGELFDSQLHIKCSPRGLEELAAEIHVAFVVRQEEMSVHCDIIPATAQENRLGVSGNSKLTSINSKDPSFATDY